MLDTGSVVFNHENENFVFKKGEIIFLQRYYQEILSSSPINIVTKANHSQVQSFFDFLRYGRVPNKYQDQIQVFQLLKESECHFSLFDSFRFRIQSQKVNGYVILNSISYSVNIGCLCFNSSVFQEFYSCHTDEVFVFDYPCSSKSFEQFLDLLHFRRFLPELDQIDQILEICSLLGCDSLSAMISESSVEFILSTILRKQETEFFDFSVYENYVCDNLLLFLGLSSFCEISLSILCRVFQRSKCIIQLSILRPFLERCVLFHGSKAFVLLPMIQFEQSNNIVEHKELLKLLSQNEHGCFYSHHITLIDNVIQELNETQATNRNLEKEINQIKQDNNIKDQRIEEYFLKIKRMDKEIETLRNVIKESKHSQKDDIKPKEKAPIMNCIIDASKNGHLDDVKILLHQGADIDSKRSDIGLLFFHCLHFIAQQKMVMIMLLNIYSVIKLIQI